MEFQPKCILTQQPTASVWIISLQDWWMTEQTKVENKTILSNVFCKIQKEPERGWNLGYSLICSNNPGVKVGNCGFPHKNFSVKYFFVCKISKILKYQRYWTRKKLVKLNMNIGFPSVEMFHKQRRFRSCSWGECWSGVMLGMWQMVMTSKICLKTILKWKPFYKVDYCSAELWNNTNIWFINSLKSVSWFWIKSDRYLVSWIKILTSFSNFDFLVFAVITCDQLHRQHHSDQQQQQQQHWWWWWCRSYSQHLVSYHQPHRDQPRLVTLNVISRRQWSSRGGASPHFIFTFHNSFTDIYSDDRIIFTSQFLFCLVLILENQWFDTCSALIS